MSWTNAFTDLQVALSSAIYNDEIWVATGTYKATDLNNRDNSFVMKNAVNLYGGFNGTETSISQRNLLENPTNLSGDIGQLGDNKDNTKKIIKIQNITTEIIIDGFRIISGYDWSESGKGAGIYFYNNSGGQIIINNCIFYNNASYQSGGALYIRSSNVTFNKCDFLYNTSFNIGGGAIYCANVSESNLNFNESRFIGNVSRTDAVINFDGYSINMDKCLITNNTATSYTIMNISSINNFNLSNTVIVGNSTIGSILTSYSSPVGGVKSKLFNVTICHNKTRSDTKETIYNASGVMEIYNSIIYGNEPSSFKKQVNNNVYSYNSIIEGVSKGENVIDIEPLFVNPSNFISAPFDASNFDYSLQERSPAINYGVNSYISQYQFDYLNNDRIQEDIVDCGAIESPYKQSVSVSTKDYTLNENDIIFNSYTKEINFKDYDKYKNKSIYIFDILGKTHYNSNILSPSTRVDLPKGIYVIWIDNKSSKKIIVH
jgi:predicted outer membrane repeat protein